MRCKENVSFWIIENKCFTFLEDEVIFTTNCAGMNKSGAGAAFYNRNLTFF